MSILIVVPVWNRKNITELSLYNLNKYKGEGNKILVYNDHSTEYDNDFLAPHCDEVKKLPYKLGVQHLRWHQLREFNDQKDYEYLYLTDSDVIHDPDYINKLKELYGKFMLPNGQKLPICLYNTIYHSQPQNTLVEKDDIVMRRTAPGVSMFFDKKMVKKIVEVLNRQPQDPVYAWDYRALEYLGLPWITVKNSYLEHFGAGGLHNPANDFDRDRAINPTPYLKDRRDYIIDYLMGKVELDLSNF